MQNAIAGIYQLRNTVTGDLYIGGSVDVMRRWRGHRSNFKSGIHSYPMQAAYREHGADSFVFELLFICEPADVKFFERRAIEALKPTYNITYTERRSQNNGHYTQRL